MARNNNRSRNNNPSGRNQYSSDWMSTVKERPIAAAAVAAASVGAGVFLWSKRNALSEQMSNLSSQISDWTESMRSGSDDEFEMASAGDSSPSGAASGSTSARTSRSTGSRPTSTRGGNRSNRGMSETGGGNASLGAHTGSGSGSAS
ncbi:hypothetical protein LZ016_05375 [Sphingomonas sp. SM33]|uniref:Uncharacterized protein n=1 Tax=Sphingomonas telluris TaxID=2907998 RepID=A0ABS9VLX7_9SPHN|nr:hypothetical protein [Sphingomonas telluris]MCH8615529.1 hypothetical protein [Sphingomonas telluris]